MPSRPARQNDRRAAFARAASLCAAAFLTACGAPAAAPAATQAPAAGQAAASTLILWHGWAGAARQALAQQVERFNRQSAGGRIILQPVALATFADELRSAALAGSGPHLTIVPSHWVGALAGDGLLLPLDDQLAAEDRRAIPGALISGASAPGGDGTRRLYGAPLAFDTLALLYNRTNLLSPPADTAALLASARGLSAPDAATPVWGLALNLSLDMVIGYLYAFGGRVFDDAGALVLGSQGRAGAEGWLAWVRALSADRRILARPDSSIAVDHELKSGHALATFDWAHQLAAYRSIWGERLGVVPLPPLAETGQPARPYVRSDALAVNARAGAAERAAALAFVRFMLAEPSQQALLQADLQPARALSLPDADPRAPALRAFRAQAEQALPMPNGADRAVVDQELRFMLQQVLSGFTSPADAVTDADRRLRSRLPQAGAGG